jgi:phage gp16-like protein
MRQRASELTKKEHVVSTWQQHGWIMSAHHGFSCNANERQMHIAMP